MAVRKRKKDLPSLEWEKVESNISLKVGEYSPIITPPEGRFAGVLVRVNGGVFRCTTDQSMTIIDEMMTSSGFQKKTPCKKDLPSLEWEEVGSDISLKVGEYSPIIIPMEGRFAGVLVRVDDGVFRCTTDQFMTIIDEMMMSSGFQKKAPNECGLYGSRK